MSKFLAFLNEFMRTSTAKAFLAALVIWFFGGCVLYWPASWVLGQLASNDKDTADQITRRGQVGDMFGVSTSLLAAGAFVLSWHAFQKERERDARQMEDERERDRLRSAEDQERDRQRAAEEERRTNAARDFETDRTREGHAFELMRIWLDRGLAEKVGALVRDRPDEAHPLTSIVPRQPSEPSTAYGPQFREVTEFLLAVGGLLRAGAADRSLLFSMFGGDVQRLATKGLDGVRVAPKRGPGAEDKKFPGIHTEVTHTLENLFKVMSAFGVEMGIAGETIHVREVKFTEPPL